MKRASRRARGCSTVLTVVLILVGWSPTRAPIAGGGTSGVPGPTVTPSSVGQPMPQVGTSAPATVAERCRAPSGATATVRPVTFPAADGVRLAGAEIGTGERGVVTLHQNDGGLCGWLAYADHLASLGLRVLVLDHRCVGVPGRGGAPEPARRRRGRSPPSRLGGRADRQPARRVPRRGAGPRRGGFGSPDRFHIVAAISGALFDLDLGGSTARSAVPRITAPVFLAVADRDQSSDADQVGEVAAQ